MGRGRAIDGVLGSGATWTEIKKSSGGEMLEVKHHGRCSGENCKCPSVVVASSWESGLPEIGTELAGLERADIEALSVLVALPLASRAAFLRQDLATKASPDRLVTLFLALLNLFESVEATTRLWCEIEAISAGKCGPDDGDKINLPSLLGALRGLELARGVDVSAACGSCAFHVGSLPNHCLDTVLVAEGCVRDGEVFMCHESIDRNGRARRPCRGAMAARKAREESEGAR